MVYIKYELEYVKIYLLFSNLTHGQNISEV